MVNLFYQPVVDQKMNKDSTRSYNLVPLHWDTVSGYTTCRLWQINIILNICLLKWGFTDSITPQIIINLTFPHCRQAVLALFCCFATILTPGCNRSGNSKANGGRSSPYLSGCEIRPNYRRCEFSCNAWRLFSSTRFDVLSREVNKCVNWQVKGFFGARYQALPTCQRRAELAWVCGGQREREEKSGGKCRGSA